MPIIDAVDKRVLEALRDHPRATTSELAEIAGVSRPTFRTRLDRLWDSGVIIGHEPQLDLGLIGFTVQAWVELEADQTKLPEIAKALDELPSVIEAFTTTGTADIRCRVAAHSTAHLQEVIRAITDCEGVSRTVSSVILSPLVNHRKVQTLDLLL
ncbi:Transcriptional regulator, AsnC family [Gulosibacter sp. 10]|nr:Transcriptional regulator, AsnC family [Gulosibacter sp. 10]